MTILIFPGGHQPDPEDISMTELQLQARVIKLCEQLGLAYFHIYHGRVAQVGFVDLTIAGPGGHIFRELKSALGMLSPAQERWRNRLRASGADYAVWTPADWRLGRIHAQLEALAEEEAA